MRERELRASIFYIKNLRHELLRDLGNDFLNKRLILKRLSCFHDAVIKLSVRRIAYTTLNHAPDNGRLDNVFPILINSL